MLVYIDEDAVEDSIGLLAVGRLLFGDRGFRSYALAVGARLGDAAGRFDQVFRAKRRTRPELLHGHACALHRGPAPDVWL